MHSLVTFFYVLIAISGCVKLPSSFQKCDRDKSDCNPCIAKAVENAISQLNHARPSVGLIGLEPLEIPFMSIAPGGGPASFSHNYTNLKLSGLTQGKVSKFDVDFDKKIIYFDFTVPHLRLDFMYDATGKILVLPIDGHGPGIIDLSDLLLSFTFDLEEYEKNDKKYYKIIGSRLTLEPKLIHYNLDNLFNGDERLGKQINDVLNDNWSDIFSDLKSSYEESFNKIFTNTFDRLLGKVPVDEIFG
ncbi:hypothetical protein Zmor_017281 [Zophobas morio]|uniref:Protein takeout n=1 Tax=Zophobas morio TaxID=2755281 RepID=A0AA38MBU8_9CUCU|nr:hypothetical protein Zmor_017281 [Zophobas morio]